MFQILENELIKKLIEIFETNIQNIMGKLRKGKNFAMFHIQIFIKKLNNGLKTFHESIFQIYWPSKSSLFIVSIIWFAFFYLSYLHPKFAFLYDGQYQHLVSLHIGNLIGLSLTDLVTIHAGISTLIFALIIFIAQSSKDYENGNRVLLKASFIFPLLIATILGFFNFIWGKVSFGNIIFTFGIGFFLIFSVYRLILILLDKHMYFEKYLNFLEYSSKKDLKRLMNPNIDYVLYQRDFNRITDHDMDDKDYAPKRFRSQLKDYRDKFIAGINSNHIGKVEESLEIYQILIKSLVDSYKYYEKAYFTAEEIDEVENRFNIIVKWFSEDVYEIFKYGMSSHNRDIILKLDSLTILTAWKGMNIENYSLFQEFIKFKIELYEASKDEPEELKSIIVEKTWRHLKETSQFLEIKLEKKEYKSPLVLKEFGIYLFKIFQNLLEEAKKQDDLESFKKFINSVNRLFKHLKPSQLYHSSIGLKLKLENGEISKDDLSELEDRIVLEKIGEEINIRKKQMLFGLATWMFNKFHRDQEYFLEILELLPHTFKDFTRVFLSTHNIEAYQFWGWLWREEIPEDTVVSSDPMGELERFYVIGALKILKNMNPRQIENINLNYDNEEYNKDLALLSYNESFINFLDGIFKNPRAQNFVSDFSEVERVNSINNFKKILEKSNDIWNEIERRKIVEKKVSGKKIKEFKEGLIKGYNQIEHLRDVFIYYESYEDRTSEIKEGIERAGISQINDKAMFFDDWHVAYGDFGYQYGIELARLENSNILQKITDYCKEIQKDGLDNKLKNLENISETIFLVTGRKSDNLILNSERFKHKEEYEFPESDLDNIRGFRGYYIFEENTIPVFESFGTNMDQVIIIEKNNLGKLVQYSPLKKESDTNLDDFLFDISIQVFTENIDLLNEFLDKPPKWLEEKGNREEQLIYLEEKVLIKIFERFEYENNENAGLFIEIKQL